MTTCSSTGLPGQPGQRVGEHRLLRVVDRGRGAHVGDAPAPGRRRLLDQEVQRPHEVARPAAGHDVADQCQRRRRHLALDELADEPLAGRYVEVPVGQRRPQGRGGRHDPPEAEEVVLERLELLVRHVLVQRRGVAGHTSARLGQAQRWLVDHAAVSFVPGPGGQPGQRDRHLRRRHHQAGECGQPSRLGGDLLIQELEHDGSADPSRHGRVGEGGA